MVEMRVISARQASTSQIEHELDVILEGFGNSHRGFRNVQLVGGLLGRLLNAALDFADVVEIFAQANAVARIELALRAAPLSR